MSISNIVIIAIILIGPFLILWYVDRHNKQKGALFSGNMTLKTRLAALVLAVGAGLLGYNQYQQSGRIGILWIVLVIAFVVYAIGFRGLMDLVQSNSSDQETQDQ